MTDQEFKKLYQYAKLGKAALDVTKKADKFGTDSLCTGKTDFEDDDTCKECEWYEFCKLLQEVDK